MKYDPENKPPLRISHIVYGRQSDGNRVRYLVDPKGLGDDLKIPEMVVLKRWRQRVFKGHSFSGVRLSPTVWRAWSIAFGRDDVSAMTAEEISARRITAKPKLSSGYLSLPTNACIQALAEYCKPAGINALVDRHNSPEHKGKSGVPDLFLYAINNQTKRLSIARFVEVKKPEEPVSKDQREEIKFLQDLGLHARVLRLIERKH